MGFMNYFGVFLMGFSACVAIRAGERVEKIPIWGSATIDATMFTIGFWLSGF